MRHVSLSYVLKDILNFKQQSETVRHTTRKTQNSIFYQHSNGLVVKLILTSVGILSRIWYVWLGLSWRHAWCPVNIASIPDINTLMIQFYTLMHTSSDEQDQWCGWQFSCFQPFHSDWSHKHREHCSQSQISFCK